MRDATPFSQVVEILQPGATGRDLVELLDGRAQRTTALHWRSGRRGAPTWAIDLLRHKLRQRLELATAIGAQMKAGPGKKAGTRNIMAYMARANRV